MATVNKSESITISENITAGLLLLQYSVTGNTLSPTYQFAGITGSGLANRSLSQFTTTSVGYSTDPTLIANPPNSTTSASLAVTNDSYFQFSIAPLAGKKMNLSRIYFRAARGGATTPRGVVVRSSIDNFTTDILSTDISTQRTTWSDYAANLSSPSFQDLSDGVIFRIYVYAPNSSSSIEIDDLSVAGTVNTAAASIKVYIDGVEKTDNVILNSISITDQLTSKVNTATFRTYSTTVSDYKPSAGSTVTIYDIWNNKIFAGIIANVEERRSGITPATTSELLTYTCSCQDYTKLLQKKLIVETYENMTCAAIISDIISRYFSTEGITINNVSIGPTISQIAFAYKSGDKCLDALSDAVGYDWYIDYDKDIHFFDATVVTPSYIFTDGTDNWTDLIIKPDRSQLRNRVFVRGGIYYSDPYTQEIEADGTAQAWLLAYTPNTANFSINVGGARTVGLKDIDNVDDFDFMLNRKEKAISMGNSAWAQANSPIAAATVISITYNYEIPVLTVQEDSDSIAALAALEGGDGAYEYMIIDKNITSISAARDRAFAELQDYANPITQGSLSSYETYGAKSGDVITINSIRRGINADYLLTTVRLQVITPTLIKYTLDFTGKLYGFVDVLLSLFKRTTDVIIGTDEVLDALNTYRDSTTQLSEATPVLTISAPPFKWSNDIGSTTNKMRWNLFQWA